mmetsp:Transcript_15902/g.29904  ORF Transcript_15902/g.29904 Transcript_15902/m.29904 type:complete len:124 (+) Transcript_15902:560-931(+)
MQPLECRQQLCPRRCCRLCRLPPWRSSWLFLCHEQCPESGSLFEMGGNWMSKVRLQRSKGVQLNDDFTMEDVAQNFTEICDFSEGAESPTDGFFSGMTRAMAASKRRAKPEKEPKDGTPPSKL